MCCSTCISRGRMTRWPCRQSPPSDIWFFQILNKNVSQPVFVADQHFWAPELLNGVITRTTFVTLSRRGATGSSFRGWEQFSWTFIRWRKISSLLFENFCECQNCCAMFWNFRRGSNASPAGCAPAIASLRESAVWKAGTEQLLLRSRSCRMIATRSTSTNGTTSLATATTWAWGTVSTTIASCGSAECWGSKGNDARYAPETR